MSISVRRHNFGEVKNMNISNLLTFDRFFIRHTELHVVA